MTLSRHLGLAPAGAQGGSAAPSQFAPLFPAPPRLCLARLCPELHCLSTGQPQDAAARPQEWAVPAQVCPGRTQVTPAGTPSPPPALTHLPATTCALPAPLVSTGRHQSFSALLSVTDSVSFPSPAPPALGAALRVAARGQDPGLRAGGGLVFVFSGATPHLHGQVPCQPSTAVTRQAAPRPGEGPAPPCPLPTHRHEEGQPGGGSGLWTRLHRLAGPLLTLQPH